MWLKLIVLVAMGLIVFLTGYWLHRAGSPYGAFMLAIHKLVALAALVFVGSLVVLAQRDAGLIAEDIYVVGVAFILVIVTFVSGGVLSAMGEAPKWLLYLHRILPYFSTGASGACVYIALTRT